MHRSLRIPITCALLLNLVTLFGCDDKGDGRCTTNAECPANSFCNNGACQVAPTASDPAPATNAPAQPAPEPKPAPEVAPTPPPEPTPEPEPAPEPEPVDEGLKVGKHGCNMRDGTGTYNRLCVVSSQPDGSLSVKAKGTSLNPDVGFEFTATGGPDSYTAKGKMSAFDKCSGSFEANAERKDVRGVQWYVAEYAPGGGSGTKTCRIMIREAVR